MTMPPNLRATLSVEPSHVADASELVAHCSLHNDGDESATLNLAPLSSPSLALEIQDAEGTPVHLPPPPVPPADIPVSTLGPGQEYSVQFSGFIPAWVPPGSYRARFRYVPGRSGGRWLEEDQWSDWVYFRTDIGGRT